MLHPFEHTAYTLQAQPHSRQGGDLFGAHTLPKIQPEDRTVALLIWPGKGALEAIVDFLQENLKSDLFLAPVNLLSRFGVDVARGEMCVPAAGRLAAAMLEMVMRGINGSF